MAVGVVNLLEVVQVQRKHRQRMPSTFRACHLRRQALLCKAPIVQSGQRIDHRQIAQNMRMVSSFQELPAQTLNQNFLVNGVDVEEYDQRDQAKHSLRQPDVKECFRPGQKRGQRQRNYRKSQQQNDEDRVAADPPIALVNAPALLRKFLGACFHGRSGRVHVSCLVHDGQEGRTTNLNQSNLGLQAVGVKADSRSHDRLVTGSFFLDSLKRRNERCTSCKHLISNHLGFRPVSRSPAWGSTLRPL